MRKALAVGRKELRQILRDRQTLGILLVVPVFFLLLYGYALNFDVKNVRLGIDDRDRSPASLDLVAAFTGSHYFVNRAAVRDPDHLHRLMNRNDVDAVLVVPEGFGRDVAVGRTATVELLINGDNANTATAVMGYALTVARRVSAESRLRWRLRAGEAGGPMGVTVDPLVQLEPRVWYNPELRSVLFLAPGLIAYISMITAVISTALSLVRERERGTMEQIRMAPIGMFSFVVGKSVPYLGISLVSALSILLAAIVLFDMPMRGSWTLLLLSTTLFLIGALGTGLVISTLATSQQVAFQMALLISFLPTFILSGFVFPISSMPVAIRAVTYLVPARYYLVALRGIVLKGVGVEVFGGQLLALAAYAGLVLVLASARLGRTSAASL